MGFNSGLKRLKSSICFKHYPAHLQEVYVVIIYVASVIVTLCMGLPCAPVKKKPEAAYIQLQRNEQGNARNM
jgi:hypothetical protein